MCCEKEIYNLIDLGALKIKNIDLPRKVRYRNKPKNKTYYKIDKLCLNNRKYFTVNLEDLIKKVLVK